MCGASPRNAFEIATTSLLQGGLALNHGLPRFVVVEKAEAVFYGRFLEGEFFKGTKYRGLI